GDLSVEWYPSLPALVHGLSKNSFAFLEYHLSWALALTAGTLLVDVWPFLAVFVNQGVARWLALGAVTLGTVACATMSRRRGGSALHALALLPAALFGL